MATSILDGPQPEHTRHSLNLSRILTLVPFGGGLNPAVVSSVSSYERLVSSRLPRSESESPTLGDQVYHPDPSSGCCCRFVADYASCCCCRLKAIQIIQSYGMVFDTEMKCSPRERTSYLPANARRTGQS